MEGIIEIIATNPPAIAMAGGILLVLTGNNDLGMQMFYIGAILQGVWMVFRYGLLKR